MISIDYYLAASGGAGGAAGAAPGATSRGVSSDVWFTMMRKTCRGGPGRRLLKEPQLPAGEATIVATAYMFVVSFLKHMSSP